jgi:hypothetical protein
MSECPDSGQQENTMEPKDKNPQEEEKRQPETGPAEIDDSLLEETAGGRSILGYFVTSDPDPKK